MRSTPEELVIAEKYLKEMLEADDTKDFALYTKRYEEKYLVDFTNERFFSDIESMHERNGMNVSYTFLSTLRNSTYEDIDIFRSVWKGVYEKRDAVIEMGIYKNNNVWYVINSAVF